MKRARWSGCWLVCWSLCGWLAGCHAWEARDNRGYDPLFTGLVVAIVLIDGLQYYVLRDGSRTPLRAPEADPNRPISVQDCTAPIDPGRGNLFCR